MKKKVLVLCYSELNLDPRLRRQVQWLKDDYDVTVSGLKNFEDIPVRFIPITPQISIDKFNVQKQKVKPIDFHLNYPAPLRKLFRYLSKGIYLFKAHPIYCSQRSNNMKTPIGSTIYGMDAVRMKEWIILIH